MELQIYKLEIELPLKNIFEYIILFRISKMNLTRLFVKSFDAQEVIKEFGFKV
jgi:hypothetical protein